MTIVPRACWRCTQASKRGRREVVAQPGGWMDNSQLRQLRPGRRDDSTRPSCEATFHRPGWSLPGGRPGSLNDADWRSMVRPGGEAHGGVLVRTRDMSTREHHHHQRRPDRERGKVPCSLGRRRKADGED